MQHIIKLTTVINVCFFFILFLNTSILSAEKITNDTQHLQKYCKDSLQWYEDHPTYKGEFVRVLDYCIKYAKDVSPEGYEVNPILSDFGSMNGVNTRPRDNIHQGIDIIGPSDQPIIAIADGIVLETTIED